MLPVVVARGGPLRFRRYRYGDPLEHGNGADVPMASAPEVLPDLLLVPLIGFDGDGNRLGQGGGYYDRTLPLLRRQRSILAIGVAFSVQFVPSLPCVATDQRLDAVVTENEWIDPVR
jgi:5-formyltetrahydrofolate cyclo-ligase